MDNNQKGHPRHYQRCGSINRYVKVTGRTIRKCLLDTSEVVVGEHRKALWVDVDQPIPSAYGMIACEECEEMTLAYISDIICQIPTNKPTVDIDFTGSRVRAYISVLEIASTLHS